MLIVHQILGLRYIGAKKEYVDIINCGLYEYQAQKDALTPCREEEEEEKNTCKIYFVRIFHDCHLLIVLTLNNCMFQLFIFLNFTDLVIMDLYFKNLVMK